MVLQAYAYLIEKIGKFLRISPVIAHNLQIQTFAFIHDGTTVHE